MEIAIVGAGWFGCHLENALKNEHDVTIFEKKGEIFKGTSGHNQNRLHLGFHYPRSHDTRIYAKNGYREFIEIYGHLCKPIDYNLYAIAKEVSLLDYETYLQIMDATGLHYTEVPSEKFGLANTTGCIQVAEQLILTKTSKEYFENELSTLVKEEFREEQIEDFDVVLNCSSQMFMPYKGWNLVYEPCMILNYRCAVDFPAVTIMDGPLCTIYPKEEDNIYTLYSVTHSPLAVLRSPTVVGKIQNKVSLPEKIKTCEKEIQTYIPNFKDIFTYCGHETSLRVSITDASHVRVPRVAKEGKIIHVLPSKIDNVFHVERAVKELLVN